jgi:phage terminase Nu1 subunit (DNA packaging protein)
MTTTQLQKKTIEKKLVSVSDVLRHFNIDKTQLRTWSDGGMPIAIRAPKAILKYNLEDIDAWIKARPSYEDETMTAARLRKMQAEASLSELSLARERGELIEIAEVATIVAREYSTIRAKLLSLPSKLSGLVYSLQDQRAVRELLDKEFRELLAELSADSSKPALLKAPAKKGKSEIETTDET